MCLSFHRPPPRRLRGSKQVVRECPNSAWRVLSAEEPGSPFHVRCSRKALGDSVRPGSTSAPIHGSRVSHQPPPAASRPLGHPGLESCGGDVDVMGAHICHLLTDVPCALTEAPSVRCLPAEDSSTPGSETGSETGSKGVETWPGPGTADSGPWPRLRPFAWPQGWTSTPEGPYPSFYTWGN